MKKKRLHLITIIALLAALFGSGGGVAWGQAYKSGYVASKDRVELRRGDANAVNSIGYIVDKTNVNNEFGAGESSSISQSGSSSIITWPDNPRNLHNPPLSIQLGSEYSQIL